MSNWRLLLSRTILGLEELEQQGQAVPEWVLGSGTALMLHANHRLSRDIDAFIDDPPSAMRPRIQCARTALSEARGERLAVDTGAALAHALL